MRSVFAGCTLGYLLVGTRLEECKLTQQFGPPMRATGHGCRIGGPYHGGPARKAPCRSSQFIISFIWKRKSRLRNAWVSPNRL